MPVGRAKLAIFLLSMSFVSTVAPLLAKKKEKPLSDSNDRRRAVHALNRLTFGPRPGDVQRVMAMGIDKWIDLQLHPEKIDDSAPNTRLEPLRTLRMNTKELAEEFPDGQEINQVRNGKRPMPSDAALRMVYQVQIARQQERKERLQETVKNTNSPALDRASSATIVGSSQSAAADGENAAMNPTSAGGSAVSASLMGSPAAGDITTSKASSNIAPEKEEQARPRDEKLYIDLDVQQLRSLPRTNVSRKF